TEETRPETSEDVFASGPSGSSLGASSPLTPDSAGSAAEKETFRLIADAFDESKQLIKDKKDYMDKLLVRMERFQRSPVSGETRPVERLFALLSGVAGVVKKATGYSDYDTLIYPCSGADMSGALSFFDLENTSSQRKYNVVTIDRSNIFSGRISENELASDMMNYFSGKLGTGISFGPYRQYLADYLLDLVLLARRFDPQGGNLETLFDSLRVIEYRKQAGTSMIRISFIINGHTIQHTHFSYFLKNKFDDNDARDWFVKMNLEKIISQAGRTILLSKAHAILTLDQDVSTEPLYPLLRNGTVVVSDDLYEQKKLSRSGAKAELVDLKTSEVANDLAQIQKDTPIRAMELSNLYWGYARNLEQQLQIFKFTKEMAVKEIAERFKAGLEPSSEEEESFIIGKCKELNFRVPDFKALGLNDKRELGIQAMALSLLEECGVDPAHTNAPVLSDEAYLTKETIFKDLRHDLKHELTPFEFAYLLSDEVDDFKDYEAILAEYPSLMQENLVLTRVLGWAGLFNSDSGILIKIYDKILKHIHRVMQLKLRIDELARQDNVQEDGSIHQAYLDASENIDQELRLFISTFDRLRNEAGSPGIKEPLDINVSIEEVFGAFRNTFSSYTLNLNLDSAVASLSVSANALQLACVWKNLITNARDVIDSNGEMSVTSKVVEKEGKKFVEVAFTDNGRFIPQEMLEGRRLFQEGESSKSSGGGAGLYLIDRIIKYHGGNIEAYSGENGPKFIMDFPVDGAISSPVNKQANDIVDKLSLRLQGIPQDFRKEAIPNILVEAIIETLGISNKQVYINKSAAELFREVTLDTRNLNESQSTRSRIEQFNRWFAQDLKNLRALLNQGLSEKMFQGYADGESNAISGIFKRLEILVNYSSSSSPLGARDFSIHVASLETLLDFVRVYPMSIPAENLISGKILNIGMETNSFTGELLKENITTHLLSQGKDVVGLDPHLGLAQKFPGKGQFVSGVAQKMPFNNNEFDTAISIGLFNPEMFDLTEMNKQGLLTLEDFYNQSAREIRRVLKNQGVLLISIGPGSSILDNLIFTRAFQSAGFDIHEMPYNNFAMVNSKPLGTADTTITASSPVGQESKRSFIEVITEQQRKDLIDKLRNAAIDARVTFDANEIIKSGHDLLDFWQGSEAITAKFLQELGEIDLAIQNSSSDTQNKLGPVVQDLKDYVEFSRKRGPFAYGEGTSSSSPIQDYLNAVRAIPINASADYKNPYREEGDRLKDFSQSQTETLVNHAKNALNHLKNTAPEIFERWLRRIGLVDVDEGRYEINISHYASANFKNVFRAEIISS
ncbi:MAG: ATP-binding protein, partial [Candidatus Omnitrophota bacterium]